SERREERAVVVLRPCLVQECRPRRQRDGRPRASGRGLTDQVGAPVLVQVHRLNGQAARRSRPPALTGKPAAGGPGHLKPVVVGFRPATSCRPSPLKSPVRTSVQATDGSHVTAQFCTTNDVPVDSATCHAPVVFSRPTTSDLPSPFTSATWTFVQLASEATGV